MIERLIDYFTVAGLLSVLCWISIPILLGVFYSHRQRTQIYWAALALAVAGWSLGEINSRSIAAIRVDRSAEEEAMRERQREVRQAEYERMLRQASGIRFAEDAPGDELDPAGLRSERQMGVYERAARGLDDEPAYRQRGRQDRVIAGEVRDRDRDRRDFAETSPRREPRTLVESALIEAQRWDRANRFILQWLFLLSVGAVVVDYLHRFNRLNRPYAPLPIAGPWLDHLFPPQPREHHEEILARLGVQAYAEMVIRKGETFCLIHPEDPWPHQNDLSRWPDWVEKTGLFSTGLPKTSWPGWPSGEIDFVLESLWFNRACYCIQANHWQENWNRPLEDFLRHRVLTRARARQTVHLIISTTTLPDASTLARWRRMADQTNCAILLPGTESRTGGQ